jgi:hypothetical protein
VFLIVRSTPGRNTSETYRLAFEKATVSTFEDVDLGVEDFGVRSAVHRPVAGSQVFGTVSQY